MSKKVSCLNPIALCGLNLLGDNYEIIEDNNDADAILVRSAQMHDMELSDKLLAVARAGAGVNNIPLDKCAEKGIVVFNTPGANANGVKELVMASMILASRDIVGGIEWVKDNVADENVAKDAEKAKKAFAGTEIAGKKLGIIGLGAIGVLVANAANRLGMEVYGCDPFISVKNALNMSRDITLVNSYDELYAKCDYITVHVPLLDATRGLLNKEAFSKMKDGVILLNFSRDTVCEADAIREALESGKVKKYVVDFPTPETVTLPNTIVTPHLGASTQESEDNCAIMAVNEIKDFIENGNIINSVNFPQCDAGVCDTKGRITICHKNVHSIISKFTGIFGDAAMNIENMVNKSRGDYAYTVLDTSDATNPEIVEKLKEIEGVIRVRIVK
ncbi:phosphoglycerate dehydrogenase [Eubacterium xylanophilum]|uniref:phosphoglycerate dehydrogenase n=1 Tax=Eubacterium xylanophilum TaxID=39497 RepID=UPI00047D02F1|nr:phosphoglycerate dehydrogenase [Eubacterium xylanophilum]